MNQYILQAWIDWIRYQTMITYSEAIIYQRKKNCMSIASLKSNSFNSKGSVLDDALASFTSLNWMSKVFKGDLNI